MQGNARVRPASATPRSGLQYAGQARSNHAEQDQHYHPPDKIYYVHFTFPARTSKRPGPTLPRSVSLCDRFLPHGASILAHTSVGEPLDILSAKVAAASQQQAHAGGT